MAEMPELFGGMRVLLGLSNTPFELLPGTGLSLQLAVEVNVPY